MTGESKSLFSVLRSKREFMPEGFRDDDGVWHDGPHRIEFDEALAEIEDAFKRVFLLARVANEGDPWFAEHEGVDAAAIYDQARKVLGMDE